jgi:hypothetical protein
MKTIEEKITELEQFELKQDGELLEVLIMLLDIVKELNSKLLELEKQ